MGGTQIKTRRSGKPIESHTEKDIFLLGIKAPNYLPLKTVRRAKAFTYEKCKAELLKEEKNYKVIPSSNKIQTWKTYNYVSEFSDRAKSQE